MAGKTISMHASEETARRMEHVARVEDRTPSQIASAALSLYLHLPPEAHNALRYVQALGTNEDLARVHREMARLLIDAQFEISERRVVHSMTVRDVDDLETEEEIIEEANRLTLPRGSVRTDTTKR